MLFQAIMSEQKPSVLVFGDGSDSASAAAQWAQCFARTHGATCSETPPAASVPAALDLASKCEVDYLVCGLQSKPVGPVSIPDVDASLAALMRRAPCPVWTVQPWAAGRDTRFSIAVVGVDPSPEACAAARAAAGLLCRADSMPRLCLVHGLDVHPAELAAERPWSEVVASMTIERHPWIERLARELTESRVIVEVAVLPVFAPELIGGVARRCHADFIALGSGWRSESTAASASPIVRQVVRASSCPILTA
jgi:hypothetical protein